MVKTLSIDDALRLREFLQQEDYTVERVRTILTKSEMPSRRLRNLPRLLYATRDTNLLNLLIRWFIIGVPADASSARQVVERRVLEILIDSGLLRSEGEQIVPQAMLLPHNQLYVANDCYRKIEDAAPDAVLSVNPTTILLSNFTIRTRSRATLDLGAGSGIQAMLAASHSDTVTATDLNPRATAFASFNARLNGLESIECLTGDLFEPVNGRKFDLIVSNPPFFITPSTGHYFCDNSMDLDLFCRRVVREGSCRLNDGGVLQMVCEWVQVKGQRWEDRLAEWVSGLGCDAWILTGYQDHPEGYAQMRMRELHPEASDEDDARFAAWAGYFEERDVEAVYGGMIALRRREGPNWVRFDDARWQTPDPFGDAVLRTFAGHDLLEQNSTGERLLEFRPAMAPYVERELRTRLVDGTWQISSLQLRMTSALPFSVALQPVVGDFLMRCNGQRTLGEVIGELAAKVNAPPERVREECLGVVRRMLEKGFLVDGGK